MAFPSFDPATNGWVPQADISWNHGSPSRKFAFIRFPNRFKTETEAITAALDMAQKWIAKDPKRLDSYADRSARGQVINVVETLKESFVTAGCREPHRVPALAERRSEKSFTFEQFKSAIAARGLKINEQMLQKSYAALNKLRKDRHLSWAETRRKVEHSQQDLRAVQSPMRRAKAKGIPLSELDWRRIG
jgi:hypothetical protein